MLERLQQRWPVLSFPFAVLRKMQDDRASSLAALVAYYAFFGIFPLLLVLVTILGIVLKDNPELQALEHRQDPVHRCSLPGTSRRRRLHPPGT